MFTPMVGRRPGLGQFMGFGESRIVEMSECRVVYRIAARDRYLVSLTVEDELSRPDSIDRVARDTTGCQDLGFHVTARASARKRAVRRRVMERRVYIDAVRVIQLVHIADLPKVPVGQPFHEALGCQFLHIAGHSRFAGHRPLRTAGQGQQPVRDTTRGAYVLPDVQVVRVARCKPGFEDLRTSGVHSEQRVTRVQELRVGAQVSPERNGPLADFIHDETVGVHWCDRLVQCLGGHFAGQLTGELICRAARLERSGFHTGISTPVEKVEDPVVDNLGQIIAGEDLRSLAQGGIMGESGPTAPIAVLPVLEPPASDTLGHLL